VTKFSLNLNKFALLRNARGGNQPDVGAIARRCIDRGVHGLTLHPRPDQRHARDQDVRELTALLRAHPDVELNVEGYPSERYLELVLQVRPAQATLVPDAPDQLTSDHGWDVVGEHERLSPVLQRLRAAGIRSSLFLDPVAAQVEAAARIRPDRIELYTEAYARGFSEGRLAEAVAPYAAAARLARQAGLGVNAGHDLNLTNLGPLLRAVPGILEVSIGHAFVCEAFDFTLEGTIDRYLKVLADAST
jgi:pyridoxine 5-phosphate synthase